MTESMTSMRSMSPATATQPSSAASSAESGTSAENRKGIRRMVFFLLISSSLGILLGQLLGTFLVAGSNRQLWLEQEAIARIGAIAVPGRFLASEMKAVSTCLAGGIFFALSLGLGYGFFCGFLLWLFSLYKGKGYRQVRLLPVIVLAGILVWLGKGSDPMVLLFLMTVPLVLYFLSLPLLSGASIRPAQLEIYGLLFLTFAVLLVVTFKQLDFIEIRDRLLLPTKAGRLIDEFYYRYTLYPARLVQPLCYRLQNVAGLDASGFPADRRPAEIRNIRTVLSRYDWFVPSPEESPASGQSGIFQTTLAYGEAQGGSQEGVSHRESTSGNTDELLFFWNGNWPKDDGRQGNKKPAYHVSYQEFMKNPADHLEKYSLAADPFALLSRGCGISLFLIIPFALALGMFAFCVWGIRKGISLFGVKKGMGPGMVKEAGIILATIPILFLPLNMWLKNKSQLPADRQQLWQLAKGEEAGDRIGALQRLDETLEPQSCQAHLEDIALLARDRDPVVRRYAAQLLGKLAGFAGQDHDENTIFPLLLSMLKDSNINVVYTAAESLGEMHSEKAREILLEILQSDRPWYLKMKVYHALKDAGWINEPKVR